MIMKSLDDKAKCCGCSACSAACPTGCIEMLPDEEGFFYPQINKERCVSCGICSSVCPIENGFIECNKENISAFVVQNKDRIVLKESTSGGAFSAIASTVIAKGGVVYGASLDESFRACHKAVSTIEDLKALRNSKYLQSEISVSTYCEVKAELEKGRLVCFSGTPCQIAGIKCFLKEDYENLITIDVVCRAVPSPMVFQKYLSYIRVRLRSEIKKIRFRDKRYGYQFSTMAIYDETGRVNYSRGIESDPWLRAFFSNICDRPSCHECVFRTKYRNSDVTLWDCFHVENYSNSISPKDGASCVLIHSQKGKTIFAEASQRLVYTEVVPEDLRVSSKEYSTSIIKNPRRQEFFKDATTMDGEHLFKKWFPISTKYKIRFIARRIANKTPFYNFLRSLVK